MSDTPIFDALSMELVFKDHAAQVADDVDIPASVLAGPSSTDAFRAVIRVGGRRAGRSTGWDGLVQRTLYGFPSPTPIYDQIAWEYANAAFQQRMREATARVRSVFANYATAMQLFASQMHPMLEAAKYSAEAHEMSRNTGWSLADCEDLIQRVISPRASASKILGMSAHYVAFDEMNVRSQSLATQRRKHYPTSSPSWARKGSR